MNSQPIQSPVKIEQHLKDLLSMVKLSDEQKEEVLTKINNAILINLIGRCFDLLSEDEKKGIAEKELLNENELFNLISTRISKEDFQKAIDQSAEEVIGKFLEKI